MTSSQIVTASFLKFATSRRAFLETLFKGTLGGATLGAGYRAGLRPLVNDLRHEAARPLVVQGTLGGPFKGPVAGADDVRAWASGREPALREAEALAQRFGDSPTRQIVKALENEANVKGLAAMSPAGQAQVLERFRNLEAARGAIGGGVLGTGALTLKNLIRILRGGGTPV